MEPLLFFPAFLNNGVDELLYLFPIKLRFYEPCPSQYLRVEALSLVYLLYHAGFFPDWSTA